MNISTDTCTLCGNRGCKFCTKRKFLEYYEQNKKPNEYGCYCVENEYCKTCKQGKILKKGLTPEYIRLLNLWLELKNNQNGIMTTGRPDDDAKIIELFGSIG